jgi:hypothetical protein
MTSERRTLLPPEDIIGFEYDCNHCHAKFSVSFAARNRVVEFCPNCNEKWQSPDKDFGPHEIADSAVLENLVESLEELKGKRFGAKIRLHLDPNTLAQS